jgi:hypothetical protein
MAFGFISSAALHFRMLNAGNNKNLFYLLIDENNNF